MFWEIEEIEKKEIKKTNIKINFLNKTLINQEIRPDLFMGEVLFRFILDSLFDGNLWYEDLEDKLIFYSESEKIVLIKDKEPTLNEYKNIEIHSDYYNLTNHYDWKKMLMFANIYRMENHILTFLLKSCGLDIIGFQKTKEGIIFDIKNSTKITYYYYDLDFIPFLNNQISKKLQDKLCFGK